MKFSGLGSGITGSFALFVVAAALILWIAITQISAGCDRIFGECYSADLPEGYEALKPLVLGAIYFLITSGILRLGWQVFTGRKTDDG